MCKRIQRFIAFLLFTAIAMSMPYSARMIQAAPPITVTINGDPVKFEIPPQIINDRVMVQIRAIAERLGCSVVWDDKTQTSYINQPNTPLVRTAVRGRDIQVYVNNMPINFPDQKPVNFNGYVLIPSRGVIEALGYSVDWNDAAQTQVIQTGAKMRPNVPPPPTPIKVFEWNGLSVQYPDQGYVVTDEANNSKNIYLNGLTTFLTVVTEANDTQLTGDVANPIYTASVISSLDETFQLQNMRNNSNYQIGTYAAEKTSYDADFGIGVLGKGILVVCTTRDWVYVLNFVDMTNTDSDIISKVMASVNIS